MFWTNRTYMAVAVGAVAVFFAVAAPGPLRGPAAKESREAVRERTAVIETLSEVEREGFRRALAEQDERYDPKERMIRRPFSSPGYHTTLEGGFVHPTRESLRYAVALLDSGEKNRLRRAQEILRRVIALQDQDPSSRTYGIWSWFLEEPLSKMSPPDWNWADFCGVQLLQVAIDHMHRLPPDLSAKVKASILHAARSIKRRNVGPGYTNIALMGTYVTLVAGERFGETELLDYGKERLRRFYDHTRRQGSFSEYNSPTYTTVAIEEISRMLRHVKEEKSRRLIEELDAMAWRHVARRFHPPTRQWSGPHSRSYSTMLRGGTLAFIQRGTGGKARFMPPEEAAVSLNAHRLGCRCPEDLLHYFTTLEKERFERETFSRNADPIPDIIGSTWLHPAFTLGSVNCGNLWNQRRPLIGYWGDAEGASAFRIRFLHDGYDYSSALFFSVQDKGDVLAAVNFATDRGDRHPSLDRLKDATIRAKDFRLRFLIENVPESFTPPSRFAVGETRRLDLGSVILDLCVAHAKFGDFPVSTEMGDDGKSAWIDVVLYHGEERQISFKTLKEGAVAFVMRMRAVPAGESGAAVQALRLDVERQEGSLRVLWKRDEGAPLALDVPTVPDRERAIRSKAHAYIGDKDAWE